MIVLNMAIASPSWALTFPCLVPHLIDGQALMPAFADTEGMVLIWNSVSPSAVQNPISAKLLQGKNYALPCGERTLVIVCIVMNTDMELEDNCVLATTWMWMFIVGWQQSSVCYHAVEYNKSVN